MHLSKRGKSAVTGSRGGASASGQATGDTANLGRCSAITAAWDPLPGLPSELFARLDEGWRSNRWNTRKPGSNAAVLIAVSLDAPPLEKCPARRQSRALVAAGDDGLLSVGCWLASTSAEPPGYSRSTAAASSRASVSPATDSRRHERLQAPHRGKFSRQRRRRCCHDASTLQVNQATGLPVTK